MSSLKPGNSIQTVGTFLCLYISMSSDGDDGDDGLRNYNHRSGRRRFRLFICNHIFDECTILFDTV